jgi:inner membrane protein
MASAFSHAFAALALGKVYTAERMPVRLWVLSAACAVLPDADVIAFAFGVRYDSMLGHRGLSHSLFFALLLGCSVVWLFFREALPFSRRWWTLVLYFFIVTASHGLLDAMTNGGLGVAFFAPFDAARYFLPWRPIEVSPIGIGPFFSARGVAVLTSEFIWIWIPAALVLTALWLYRRLLVRE